MTTADTRITVTIHGQEYPADTLTHDGRASVSVYTGDRLIRHVAETVERLYPEVVDTMTHDRPGPRPLRSLAEVSMRVWEASMVSLRVDNISVGVDYIYSGGEPSRVGTASEVARAVEDATTDERLRDAIYSALYRQSSVR